MLRYTLRRALWAVPTLFGVSFVVFLLTTLFPDPATQLTVAEREALLRAPQSHFALEERRRRLFLDLPRVVNVTPRDVRVVTDECMLHLQLDDEQTLVAANTLVRLGGAALPHVLPRLDTLEPEGRRRVARALLPLAARMGLEPPDTTSDPDAAVLFWRRFWDDRATDFTAPAIRRGVARFAQKASPAREHELAIVDTFALRELLETAQVTRDPEVLARLTGLMAHATQRSGALAPDASEAEARRALADWQSWWFIHEPDFVVREGMARVSATLGDTRYAKWTVGAATGQLGLSSRDNEPVYGKLQARAPVTFLMASLAMLLAFALAVPIGAFTAWRRGKAWNRVVTATLFIAYSLPTFWVAQVLFSIAGVRSYAGVAVPVVALALTSIATLSRHQRASLLEVVHADYVRTAKSKGASATRLAIVHGLRNAILPTITLAGLQFPALLGGAFVIEEVFSIRGMGWETLRAIEAHDTAWIVATVLLSAVVTTATLIASDVALGLLDPRVRERQLRGKATS